MDGLVKTDRQAPGKVECILATPNRVDLKGLVRIVLAGQGEIGILLDGEALYKFHEQVGHVLTELQAHEQDKLDVEQFQFVESDTTLRPIKNSGLVSPTGERLL